MDALVSAGANQMNGINFSIRDSAAAAGRSGASGRPWPMLAAGRETYAIAAGVSLGPILSISESAEGHRATAHVSAWRMA